MHGKPALGPGFEHFPHARGNAPKAGTYRAGVTGSFDSVNPFIQKGEKAKGLYGYVFESLMARNHSESFSLYGLLAERVEMPDDRRRITFYLNPKARFSNGRQVLASDVLASFEALRDKGRYNYQSYYRKVQRVRLPDRHTITFYSDGHDRELPLILGLMPVMPRDFAASDRFGRTTLKPLTGSGPYVMARIRPGVQVVLKRNPDYWAKDLPVSRGLWNFDTVVYEYFRDQQTAFEAFRKGLVDVRLENSPVRWARGYDFGAVRSGKVVLETIPTGIPKPAYSLVFNTRRALFQDRNVRLALINAFDFEWANANLFHGMYERTYGFFAGSILSSKDRPASALERQILKKAGAKLPVQFIEGRYSLPKTNGSGHDRNMLKRSVALLARAGWHITGGALRHKRTGEPFSFEIIVQTGRDEKIALWYRRTLRLAGINVTIRKVDSPEFQRRLLSYDFDMIPFTWHNSLSPGNEQAFYWGSAGRKTKGTRNYPGIADAAVDRVIDELVRAGTREKLVAAARALDRLLVAGAYTIPLYHAPGEWLARWRHIARPEKLSLYGFLPQSAWYEHR